MQRNLFEALNIHHEKFGDVYASVANGTISKESIKKFNEENNALIALVGGSNLPAAQKATLVSDLKDYKENHISKWLNSEKIPELDSDIRYKTTPRYK